MSTPPTDTGPDGVTQTIIVGDGTGRPGNCLQAAVATLLGLPLVSVPHFLEDGEWHAVFVQFLQRHGLTVTYNHSEPPAFGLAFGKSARGQEHAVVYRSGLPDWDPHPDRTGLVSVSTYAHIREESR